MCRQGPDVPANREIRCRVNAEKLGVMGRLYTTFNSTRQTNHANDEGRLAGRSERMSCPVKAKLQDPETYSWLLRLWNPRLKSPAHLA